MKPARGFAPILIVLVIISLLIIGFAGTMIYLQYSFKQKWNFGGNPKTPQTVASPSPLDETVYPDSIGANWKTYTVEKALATSQPDIKYKYSVKYPQDWTFKENGLTTFFLPPGESYIKDKILLKSIYISVRDKRAAVLPVYIKYKTIREIKIEDETVKILQAENLATERYLAEITRVDYVIKFAFSQYLDSKYDDIFDQILSTFKFLN